MRGSGSLKLSNSSKGQGTNPPPPILAPTFTMLQKLDDFFCDAVSQHDHVFSHVFKETYKTSFGVVPGVCPKLSANKIMNKY